MLEIRLGYVNRRENETRWSKGGDESEIGR